VRIRNKVKKEVAQELSPEQKVTAAEFGNDDELHKWARHVLGLAYHGLYLKQIEHKLPPGQGASVEEHYKRGVRLILEELWNAMRPMHRTGSFFRALADEIDRAGPIDPVRHFVGVQIEAAKAFGQATPTLRDFKRNLKGVAGETTIERAWKEFGGKGKAGRPRKSRPFIS
jgi:hypothetical protein